METRQKKECVRVTQRETQLAIVGFEDGRGSGAKECGQSLEAGKSK